MSAFVGWLLTTSLQAAVLVCAVLLVQRLIGRRISAQWRHALWLLLLLRLVMPWAPQSRYSVYSLAPRPLIVATPRAAITTAWAIGAAGFASWLLIQAFSTLLAFRGRRPVTDKAVLDLLEDCKEELGVHNYLAVVETPHARAPALFGWIRPRLLLPSGVLDKLSRERLRHVFLHELAHLKRHDIALNWLMALVQTVHWFNPLVWLAFQRARADMELACDELALSHLQERESSDYGNTILQLLDTGAEPNRLPVLAAIAEDAHQVKRRIQMIAAFRKGQYASHMLPVAILLLLGVVFLVNSTDAQSNQAEEKTPPADAAIQSAKAWVALLDTGRCDPLWAEFHSVVRGMMSQKAWDSLCEDLLATETAERGKATSRKPAQIEYLPNLPMGLGGGVSVRFSSKYDKGVYAGPKLILAKDRDGVWRVVRADRE
jgi:bla regulator protein BlaR1